MNYDRMQEFMDAACEGAKLLLPPAPPPEAHSGGYARAKEKPLPPEEHFSAVGHNIVNGWPTAVQVTVSCGCLADYPVMGRFLNGDDAIFSPCDGKVCAFDYGSAMLSAYHYLDNLHGGVQE
jgi:hypothetical protein